ncbi:hypothetical protein BDN72DRAFT_848660 [Pluteus cervinus]|uniref:Uncharacterized protein n=1 Tax=Pluteus cervinus TaxID=181527 RepID=A0ACD3AAV9_9AGAR|nr:hypothetical protein BDN72DRAFT_848660 [Pluteus cervinus]
MENPSALAVVNVSPEPLISSDSSPIACLPLEILPLIFLEVLQASRAKYSAILTISRVARHWRIIALSTPELWTWIDTHDVGIIQTFMTRAKDRPLSVSLHEVEADNDLPVNTVLQALHNIRHLELSVHYHTDWTRMGVFDEMEGPAPILETLNLDGVCLPETLFAGSIPSLQHLHLDSFDIGLESIPDCPQLRSLRLIRPEEQIHIPEFLRRLPTFPLLEVLETVGIFESYSGGGDLPGPVELPNLRTLRIESELVLDAVHLLERLRVPTSCKIKLDVSQRESHYYLSLFPALPTCRTGPTAFIRKVKILAAGWLTIETYEGDRSPTRDRHAHKYAQRSNVKFTIWPPDRDRKGYCIHMAADVCQNYLDLSRLETIDLLSSGLRDHPTQSFWTYVDSLSTLRVLKVRQSYASSFIDYISTVPPSTGELLPPFSTINELVYEDPSDDADGYIARLTELVQYLRMRAAKGLALTTLTLVHVKKYPREIPNGVRDDLRGMVQQVRRKVKGIVFDAMSSDVVGEC